MNGVKATQQRTLSSVRSLIALFREPLRHAEHLERTRYPQPRSGSAPWSLLRTLRDALRFVQGNLGPASPGVEPAERLFRVEIAATNGMLSVFDGRSALLDVETYQKVRPHFGPGQTPTSGDGDVPHSAEGPKAGSAKERGSQQRKEFLARNDGHEPGGALVVLVNHRTASASELVAAAIKNLGRGVVVGEPTAGAATIRVLFDIPKGPLKPPPSRHAASDRDIIQDVIDGKAPTPSPPPPDQPDGDRELLGLVLATGRLLASGGAEIEGVGVVADIQPACPADERIRPGEDCLLLLAQDVIARAKDPQRSTLLSTAKELASTAARPRPTRP